jgi:hypothetical protein
MGKSGTVLRATKDCKESIKENSSRDEKAEEEAFDA